MEKQEVRLAKNGIKILSYKNTSVHSCHISLYVRAGCMYERAEENGITFTLLSDEEEQTEVASNLELYGGLFPKQIVQTGSF